MARIIYILFFFATCSSFSYAQDAQAIKNACFEDAKTNCPGILEIEPPTRENLIACGRKLLSIPKTINPTCTKILKEIEKEGKLS